MRRRVSTILAAAGFALLACGPGESGPTGAGAREVQPASPAGADSAPRPSVVLITLESLRTDHVGAYGGRSRTRPEEPITPTLDALAEEAVVYERAHSVTSWTLASHASLFTGLYPSAHQTQRPLATLGDDYETLAVRLADVGYQTAAAVSGPYLRSVHNLTQGFDWIDDSSANPLHPRAHSDVTNAGMEAALIRFVELEREAGRPFFLFAYFWDPHFDFLPPEPYDRLFVGEGSQRVDMRNFETGDAVHPDLRPAEFDFLLSQYDGEIRATDELLGRFFGLLRQRGLWDDTLVIVTSDHGEEFFDHGEKGHKKNLYQETVQVPLFVKYPRRVAAAPPAGSRDSRLVSLVDVVPTVLELAGAPAADPTHGYSLLDATDDEREIYFELLASWYTTRVGKAISEIELWTGIRHGDQKLIRSPDDTRLFDLASDPGEQRNLFDARSEDVDALDDRLRDALRRIRAHGRRFKAGATAEVEDEATDQLCALGYLKC